MRAHLISIAVALVLSVAAQHCLSVCGLAGCNCKAKTGHVAPACHGKDGCGCADCPAGCRCIKK